MNSEALLELIRGRRSIRRFAAQPVDRTDLDRLFEAARWAPSNHNRQGWRFLVFEGTTAIGRLADAVDRGLRRRLSALPPVAAGYAGELLEHATGFRSAPVLIAVAHKCPARFAQSLLAGLPHPDWVSGEPLSAAMAVQNLLLVAHALGLGACVCTAPLIAAEDLAGAVVLPPGFEPTCLIAVGHPAERPEPPRRKSIDQIVEYRHPAESCDPH